jgi:hypothetical protein
MPTPDRVLLLACSGLLTASLASAGQGPSSAKAAPNQAPESGHQDVATVTVAGQQVHIDPVTGQLRQPTAEEAAALAAALERQFGQRLGTVTFAAIPGGGVAARLDESFMDALIVTKNADGTLSLSHAPAGASTKTSAAPKAAGPASRASSKARGRSAPKPVSQAPTSTLEEK